MAVLKSIELMADSKKSWEDAAQVAVKHASKTLRNIRSVYVNNQSATVDKGRITGYRVNVNITFEVE
jgi:dodecin